MNTLESLTSSLFKKQDTNKVKISNSIINHYANGEYISKNRLIHFYGDSNCGKTALAKNIIMQNECMTALYVSNKLDDFNKIKDFVNSICFISNTFEDIITYIEEIPKKGLIDLLILDNFQMITSKEEMQSSFSKQLSSVDIVNKYIKKIALLAVKKDFNIIILNEANSMSGKASFGVTLNKESIATFRINESCFILDSNSNIEGIRYNIKPDKNLLSNIKEEKSFNINIK